nr:putative ribonuclease H-like domain-containing protein [Tanacetum cinerariifolium]
MRPFGCPVTILNTLDPLCKFKGKVDEGFLVGYMLFPVWSFGSSNPHNKEGDAAFDGKEHDVDTKKLESAVNVSPNSSAQSRKQYDKTNNDVNAVGSIVPTVRQNSSNNTNPFSAAGPSNITARTTHGKSSFKDASQLLDNPDMPEDITYFDNENVGAETGFNNLETSITVSPIPTTRIHKDHPVSQICDLSSNTQTRSMTRVIKDQVARIEAIRLFLAYASFMGFMVYQMDINNAFLYGTIEEECKKKTVVATSSTEAEYVATASCCTQVLWIQNQLLDYSYIKYALAINPHIYVSCIKQFWNIVVVKQTNDVTRLQALVNKKKVVITEATIKDALCLDDVEGVDCLTNEEIFAELARMGYEKPSTKLTFYKDFFSSQWKFLIHTILQSMSAKCTSWNEFSSVMTYAVICLSVEEQVPDIAVDDAAAHGVDTTIQEDTAQEPSVPSPTPPTPSPQPPQDLPSTSQRIDTLDDTVIDDASNQGRMIDALDSDAGVALMDEKKEEKKAKEDKVAVTAASTTIFAAEPQVPAATITAAPVRVNAASTRRRKGVVIRDPEEESSTVIPSDTKSKDKGKGIVVEESKPLKKKQQVEMDEEYARKLHEELNKDIDWDVAIDHNVARFRLDYFKGMSYDDIRPVFEAKFNSNIAFLLKSKEQLEEEENRAIESINETPAQKAAKRRTLNEEVEDLKRHLEIVPDEDDDVYTKATPLARKVPVVDYEIIHLNYKPHYKIIRADGTHQLYVGFLTLLKNFDREDLESLWSLVKERFSTSNPNNFSDDFLLTTLGAMFERPDGQAQV